MTERKITSGSFDKGPLRKILSKKAYAAHLTEQGRMRVEEALKAGVARANKKFGLQHGLGAGHADALAQFPTSRKYHGRFDPKVKLKPKELGVVKDSLNVFFKQKPAEPKVEMKVEPAPRPEVRKFVPPAPMAAPKAANDNEQQQAA